MINKEELFDKRINIKDLFKIRGASFFLFVIIVLFNSYTLFAQTDKNTQEKAFFLNEEIQNKIALYEDLIEKEGGKIGDFIRKTIEKQYNIKFVGEYDKIGRRPNK